MIHLALWVFLGFKPFFTSINNDTARTPLTMKKKERIEKESADMLVGNNFECSSVW